MSHIHHNYGPDRLPRPVERERDVKTEQYEPRTELEYRALVKAMTRLTRWITYLRRAHDELMEMPELYRDALNGKLKYMDPLELGAEVAASDKLLSLLEQGADAWRERHG